MTKHHELVLWWHRDGSVRLCADGGWCDQPNALLRLEYPNLESAVAQWPHLRVVLNWSVV